MTTQKQKQAARQNIKKAHEKWQNMTPRQRAQAQPEGKDRAEPGEKGGGEFYRIRVRRTDQFISFRTHDVGDKGGIERIAGHRKSGSWGTQAWLISKDMAKKVNDSLVATHEAAQEVLDQLGSKPKHIKGDIFQAKPRVNVPEKDKPTPAQKQAVRQNIQKAQDARWG